MKKHHTLKEYENHEKIMTGTRLLDRVHHAVRVRQYSFSTEKIYIGWIRRFILFHGKRHPAEMDKLEIEAFLTHLAVNRAVSPSTQNQACTAGEGPPRSRGLRSGPTGRAARRKGATR